MGAVQSELQHLLLLLPTFAGVLLLLLIEENTFNKHTHTYIYIF